MKAVSPKIDMIVPIDGNAAQAAAIVTAFEAWYAEHKSEIPWLHREGVFGDEAPELGVVHFGALEPHPRAAPALRSRLARCAS